QSNIPIFLINIGDFVLRVHQSPSDIITEPDAREQISCSHDKTDHRLMLWYQRSPRDTALKLIGYLNYQSVTMEEPYKDNFTISGDLSGDKAKKVSLITNVTGFEHTAVYYCATSRAH
uniref:Ig-like domain-containing protein n=1 Tax=Mola mola TaxID=94237 RepID=A0A3Q3WHT5_MOLML